MRTQIEWRQPKVEKLENILYGEFVFINTYGYNHPFKCIWNVFTYWLMNKIKSIKLALDQVWECRNHVHVYSPIDPELLKWFNSKGLIIKGTCKNYHERKSKSK